MHIIHDYPYNIWFMKKVLHTIWFLFLPLMIVQTTWSQDDMLLISEKNEFSEVRFFGIGGANYLMKDNPQGKRLGVGLDVGLYYRTSRILHIGVTMGLHSVHSTKMDYDFNRLVVNNKVNISQMAVIDFSQITYLIPLALCARFDVASKDIVPFIRVDGGINYILTESKGKFTEASSATSRPTKEITESYSYFAPLIGLAFGIDYSINPSLALSAILKIHTTYDYNSRDIGLRSELVDFSPKYTMLSIGITKKL